MGFLSSLFGGKPSVERTAVMMDEERYWDLVDGALARAGGDPERQLRELETELERMQPADVIGFRLRTDKLLFDTYTSKMWCAGYLMNGGCSDDAFEYFRLWVISRGRTAYENAKANPDTLVDLADAPVHDEFFDNESFWYVANDVFEKKTGLDLYEFIDTENFTFREGHYEQFEFDWEEDDPESMRAHCPKLYDRFAADLDR